MVRNKNIAIQAKVLGLKIEKSMLKWTVGKTPRHDHVQSFEHRLTTLLTVSENCK